MKFLEKKMDLIKVKVIIMKEHELKTLLQLDYLNNRRGLTYNIEIEIKLPMN